MANRKDKPVYRRIFSSIAALMLTGSIIFIVVSGFNLYVSALLATGFLGLAAPSVSAGDSFIEIIIGFFEALLDGLIDVVAGIFEAIASLFG